ncbi:putative amidoligase enzyme [Roseibium hamelinense]|uniref:Putative amidoligase enzyme n=2 Tax=Roseibium hamelinense TaxID=150831 RepID=A0A562SE29_9HYPH|nr:amidoligase enzyme [Roseibium hamelinense]TWI79527.1 putative amidoligase enzyme [Roseibium hamelinense]
MTKAMMTDMREDNDHDAEAVFAELNSGDRRVGVEIEFGGLSASKAAKVVYEIVGGDTEEVDAHRYKIHGTSLGTVTIELDSKYVHTGKDDTDAQKKARQIAGDLGTSIVPTELITAPIFLSDLGTVDTLARALADAGAMGNEQPHLACGLHLNIEWKSESVEALLRVLQAYLLMAPKLREEIEPDPTRKLLPFIARFPSYYERTVLDPAYQPDLETFIRDYCAANPNKNRELDLLPLLASLNAGCVEEAIGKEPKAVRPAFHYRLPDARIGDAAWSVAEEWKRWKRVEELAADQQELMNQLENWRADNEQSEGLLGAAKRLINRVKSS